MNTDGLTATEAECAAGRTAPRVSLDDIKANIAGEYFNTASAMFPGAPTHESMELLTVCILVLQNGFTIIGKSAPASRENFDPELGQKLAYEDAVRQVWPLMGYALREQLYQQEQGKFDRMEAEMSASNFHPTMPTAQIPLPEGFKEYVGTKRIYAQPMTRADYNELRGWDLPADEDGSDDGYLVEYTDGGKSNVPGFDGYVSWSPRDIFDRAYSPV
jgi:hypothetical protein